MLRNLRLAGLVLAVGLMPVGAARVEGQVQDDRLTSWPKRPSERPQSRLSLAPTTGTGRGIRWYHGLGALGAVALASLGDEMLQEETQSHRSDGKDDLARVFRHMGEPVVYAAPGLAALAAGVVLGDGRVTRAGGRITAGLLTAGLVTNLLKPAVGRWRPSGTSDAFRFDPFSGRKAWPSGHATMAFALATGVSDELRRTPITVALYTAASLTAWSRVNDNRHWGSDVLAGALVGITSAKLMNGRWRVFGIRAPHFLLEPNGVGIRAEF